MIKELNHIGLFTANMDVSRHFYVDILGGVVIRDFKNAEHLSQLVFIQLALGVIELIRVPPDASNKGLAHVAYLIDAERTLDENYQYLHGRGMTFTVLPKPTSAGDGRLTFFQDFSGAIFELIQREENIRIRDLAALQARQQANRQVSPSVTAPVGLATVSPKQPAIAAFNHVTIQIPPEKAESCDRFYTTDMGLMRSTSSVTPDGRKTLYAIGSDRIELHETLTGVPVQPLCKICFGVDGCAAMRSYLIDQGITSSPIMIDPDGTSLFTTSGPDGESIEWTDRIES